MAEEPTITRWLIGAAWLYLVHRKLHIYLSFLDGSAIWLIVDIYFCTTLASLSHMLHVAHGYSRSMDKISYPWMEYLSMEIGTYSWSYSTHLMGKYPPIACTFPWISRISMDMLNIYGILMDLLLFLALYLRSRRPRLLLLPLLFIILLPLLAIYWPALSRRCRFAFLVWSWSLIRWPR